ncbi:alpha/beta hydrolase [Bacillus luteolus]|uniref:Alpha/beta hydrolase n=1 Tax=Litchfieldia luteola TaxID=682179 RepID=A0ABR9QM69_9BACI|nr:alpha/beta hydrolase [Cytobacillus luteolus]MBE4909269.1 alpha/beta hydrolase [Cytobacillus luteolus]MBP1940663.1 pimeloyl-ACP methyl ester carboxylesterase [Cytobacillus luteolus]
MPTIQLKSVKLANGETLGYREREGGEHVVLLIHGNMTSSKHWDLVLENMDEDYKLYAVDMRGFGISTYMEPVNSIKDFSDDIKLFVDELGLKDFTIIGWSTGGAVGMQFVGDYPGYCQKLVLLASASTRGYPFFDLDATGQLDITKRLVTKEDIDRDRARTIPVQQAYDTNDQAFLKGLWNMMIYRKNQPEETRYNEYVEDMMTQRNLRDVYYSLNTFNISNHHNGLNEGTGLVGNIKIPVLVLRGNEDLVITENMAKEIVEDLGEYATFVELKGCGHSPLVDDLEQLLGVVAEFLEEKELSK